MPRRPPPKPPRPAARNVVAPYLPRTLPRLHIPSQGTRTPPRTNRFRAHSRPRRRMVVDGKRAVMTQPRDETVELLQRWHAGEREALDVLLDRNLPRLHRFARAKLHGELAGRPGE